MGRGIFFSLPAYVFDAGLPELANKNDKMNNIFAVHTIFEIYRY